MKAFRIILAAGYLVAATGCSQISEVPKSDAMRAGELKNATVRTRTGEVYFFERARVDADSLSGFAQERSTVYLPGGDVTEVTQDRQVYLALADVEQLTVQKRSWGHTGLWALVIGGAAGAVALVASQSNNSKPATGGGDGRPPKGSE